MEKINNILTTYNEWDLYNSFFLMDDIDRLRKFMVRQKLFEYTINIPGDIVELGVMKGIGIAQLMKIRNIFIPNTIKKVIGFDFFEDYECKNSSLNSYYNECDVGINDGIKKEELEKILNSIDKNNNSYKLIKGNIFNTIPKFLQENPGFRISYINFDLDIEEPTIFALEQLYSRIVRGGIMVFDEYACHNWSESNAVDKFIENHRELEIKTVYWANTPSAYIIKN